ncbi:hypothetical protein D1872_299680 [compost metagenome]|jgi:hypothetical protein
MSLCSLKEQITYIGLVIKRERFLANESADPYVIFQDDQGLRFIEITILWWKRSKID